MLKKIFLLQQLGVWASDEDEDDDLDGESSSVETAAAFDHAAACDSEKVQVLTDKDFSSGAVGKLDCRKFF